MRIRFLLGITARAMGGTIRNQTRIVIIHLISFLLRIRTIKNIQLSLRYRFIYFFFLVLIITSAVIPFNYSNNQIFFEIPECDIVDDIDDYVGYLKVAVKHSNYTFCERFPTTVTVPMQVYTTLRADFQTMADHLKIRPGGRWSPSKCIPYQKVAIIVPYRNRPRQLDLFLQHMHVFLQAQNLEYVIVIVEQTNEGDFNRGKLLNIGFKEMMKDNDFWCYIFHDIDLFPESPKNLYSCAKQPRHICSHINTFRYVLPYRDLFGGVVSFNREQFELINGYSNLYFGWGAEDDDLFIRVKARGMEIHRWARQVSRCFMLKHVKSPPNDKRYHLLAGSEDRMLSDGLNSLEYEVLAKVKEPLYTHYLVKVID